MSTRRQIGTPLVSRLKFRYLKRLPERNRSFDHRYDHRLLEMVVPLNCAPLLINHRFKTFYRHNSDSIAPAYKAKRSLIFSRRDAWIRHDHRRSPGKLMERCYGRVRKKIGDQARWFFHDIVVKIFWRD